MATKQGKGKAGEELSFEQAMNRLETIVDEMESGELSLENMIARFVEGQELVKSCTARLNDIEKKVELLVRKGDSVTTVPFDEGGAGAAAADERPGAAGNEGGDKDVPF